VTILSIRKHQRFAVRRKASLCPAKGKRRDGLLVELSLEGCRVGITSAEQFAPGEPVKVRIDGYGDLAGEVRWAQAGLAGLRFLRPLHIAELGGLIQLCRGLGDAICAATGPETGSETAMRRVA
jgi:PilZ domain